MEFARRQLEKYGWSDGKGLGRREDGIAQALRPQLKRSAAGVGHDPAAEHNDHWWSALYDAAAANVEVKGANGKTKGIRTRDPDAFVISDKSWRISKRRSETKSSGYMEHFVKTAVLTSGGVRTERLASDDPSDEEAGAASSARLTDEQLLAACGGRTAHKGARHGLRAKGKLARIEEQERELLKQARYEGYSQASAAGTQEQCSEVNSKHIAEKSENDSKHSTKEKRKRNSKNNPVNDKFDETIYNSQNDCHETDSKQIADYEVNEDSTNYKKKHKKNKGTKGLPNAKANYSQDNCVEKDLNEVGNQEGLDLMDNKSHKKRKLTNQGEQLAVDNSNSLETRQDNLNVLSMKATCEVTKRKKLGKNKGTIEHITRDISDDNSYWDNIYEKEKLGKVNTEVCLHEISEVAEVRKKSKKHKRKELSVEGEMNAENTEEYQTSETLQGARKCKKKRKQR